MITYLHLILILKIQKHCNSYKLMIYLNFIFISYSIQLFIITKYSTEMLPSNYQTQQNTFNLKRGHEQVSQIHVIANIGTKIKANIEITTIAVTLNEVFDSALNIAKNYSKNEDLIRDYEKYDQSKGFGFLFGLFGIFQDGDYYNQSKKIEKQINTKSAQPSKELVNKISSLTETKILVKGQIQVEGVSSLPSQAIIFVETMKVKGKDQNGKLIDLNLVCQNSLKALDPSGNETCKLNCCKLEIILL